jgi:Na+/melibiose symporter-like transporter
MFSFGVGEAAGAFQNMAWNVLLLFFYQQVVGVEAGLVGLAIGIATICDAITDPLIGAWSDRLHTRWGRRHPMLLISTLPLAVSFVLLFNPPTDISNLGGFLWLTGFGVMVRASYTFYNIPHLSLGAEMSTDYQQRSLLFAFSAFVGAMSVAVAYGLITGYYFPTTASFDPGFLNPVGYPRMSLTFAAVMVGAIILCVLGTRGEIPHLRANQVRERVTFTGVFREMQAVFGNASFRAVFFGSVLAAVIAGIEGAFNPFMGIHFWGLRTEQLFYLAFVGLISFPLSFLLIPLLTRWLDKKYAVIVPLAAWILAVNTPICLRLAGVPWFPDNESSWILVIFLGASTVGAVAAPIIGATANSMMADIADEHELDTGIRREGVLYSVRAFSNKAVGAVGVLIGGVLLSVIEFPKQAVRGQIPEDVVWNLGLIAGPATSVFSLVALIFYLRYRITRQRHQEVMKALKARSAVSATGR